MEVGVTMEIGQNALFNVGEEVKLEPGHVTTQLQLMVVQIVWGKVLKLSLVTMIYVQVKLEPCFTLIIILNNHVCMIDKDG
jgi:hypothetical protein